MMEGKPQEKLSEQDRQVHSVERLIGRLLRIGVNTSLALVVLGTILSFAQFAGHGSTPADLQRLTGQEGEFPRSMGWMVDGLRQWRGPSFIVLGLAVLIATPVMRVAVSIMLFARQRDRAFVIITSTVLMLLILSFVMGKAAGKETPKEEWTHLDNGQIRLGVKVSSGAAIGYLSASSSKHNLLNHYDHGRLVQQSYYGKEDGSLWNKKPWRWNPVQGGDWRGSPARVLEIKADKTTLYAKTLPKHWASGEDLPEVVMEQWITLTGRLAHVRYRMTYKGDVEHPRTHQEIPAFFAQPELSTLVLYDGDKPWTGGAPKRLQPGWPNEGHKITENWAAYVDENDRGVGAYVPVAKEITSYRYKGGSGSDCSYFAPLATFAVKPGLTFEYDAYLAIGTSAEMRAAFDEVRKARAKDEAK